MLKRERNSELIEQFVEQLELYGLEMSKQLDQIEQKILEYHFFSSIKEQIEESKIDFCSSYFALEETEKEKFRKRFLDLFKDEEIVDNIIQEIINLYYLKQEDLLDLEEVSPQKEIAFENLETLLMKIKKYLADVSWQQLTAADDKISEDLNRLVSLGSVIEGDEEEEINDLDFLKEVLESLSLTEEEKVQILLDVMEHNLAVYETRFTRKKKNEPIVETIGELKPNPVISKECLNRINELLSKKEVIEKIVRIVNDEFTTVIDIHAVDKKTREVIEDSLDIAREEIMESIKNNQGITVEEALADFFKRLDTTPEKNREILRMLTENTVTTLSKEEQQEILIQALQFEEENKQGIHELSTETKEKIRQYMLSLYQFVENRKLVYDSQAFETDKEIKREAAYEIQVYRELLASLPPEEEELYAKVCVKIKEIFDCLKHIKKKSTTESITDKNLFFLVVDETESTLEEDMELDHAKKGISSTYYGDINNQLLSIENRSEKRLIASQPTNPGLRFMKKNGVRFTTGGRTRLFFIPVGKKDAIIVGASFIEGKDDMRLVEQKVKKYQDAVTELKKRLEDPETYQEEVQEARIIRKRIELHMKNQEIREMVEPTEEQKEMIQKVI